ncbi:MAG: Crp/Fnr family transcriptional regulator [Burkholderiales bacterium]|nr:Crp/Fnr family transcriptional regulator [Burkholderiales bacterium]
MTQSLLDLVSHLPLLAGLDAQTLAWVSSLARLRSVASREVVLRKGDKADALFFVVKGRVQVIEHLPNGREVGLGFIAAGEFFGELAIIDGLPRSASIVACEDSLLLAVPADVAQALFYRQPLVAERLLKHFAKKLRVLTEYQTILNLPNAYQRVFALLERLARTQDGGAVVIERLPTQQQIAIMVNTSRETVSRALHVMLKRGVLQRDSRRLIVNKPELLHLAAVQEDSAEGGAH